MNARLQRIVENLIPFLILGVAIALIIGLFIMFSYVLVWGLLIGGVLWAISAIKTLIFSSPGNNIPTKTKGRIIEHNDEN